MRNTDENPTPADVGVGPPLRNRRWVLGAGGAGLAAAIVAACSGDDDEAETGSGDTGDDETTTSGGGAGGDVAVAQLAASLEVLAVQTYDKALDAAASGALGPVPPAVGEFVTTARDHHQAHLDGWNGVITGAGETAVSMPPADLAEQIDAEFAEVGDVNGAAALALKLEETAAATYLGALRTLKSSEARTTAGAIICIDRQHAAILNFVLGNYPVPDTFATTDLAYQA